MFSFIETKLFTKLVKQYLSDESYSELQAELMANPKRGVVIRGSGGIRKIRWAADGCGKSGGNRVINFVRKDKGIVWMLTMYPKNVADSISGHLLRKIREEIESDE